MGIHSVHVIPFHLELFPSPHPREKPQILPGLWLEQMTDTFGTVARQIPLDPTIMDINMVMVLDYPEYTQGLLARLPDTVRNPAILKELSERHQGMADGYDQHPLEIDIQEEDIRKLLIASCIIAGATAVVINKPVLAELTEDSGKKILKFDRTDNLRHVWQLPHKLQEKVTLLAPV